MSCYGIHTAFLLMAAGISIAAAQSATSNVPHLEPTLVASIPMRDGIHLAADVYLPDIGGSTRNHSELAQRWPAVLIRTPYSRKARSIRSYLSFRRRGYAVVTEDVRGRYASEGIFGTIDHEGPDGNDTINWIAEQPWSNGEVAMAGSSYLGMVQWWAAIEDNPHLDAISPMCSGDDEYLDRFYSNGGALQLGHRLLWLSQNLTPRGLPRPPFSSYIAHLPLRTADIAAAGKVLAIWQQALDHPSYDSFWKNFSIRERIARVDVPVLSFGGWFDNYAESDLDAFSRLAVQHKTVETWIGPWAHNPAVRFPTHDFGPDALLIFRRMQAEWFDRWLAPPPRGRHMEPYRPSLHLFVMGANVWREEHEWPLARTRYTPAYLNSRTHANSVLGDGTLQWGPAGTSNPDTFIYDPKNPVPTDGGTICCDAAILPPGPLSQAAIETRRDILVYTSPVLNQNIEVTGPVRVILYVSTSLNDSDFTAKLVDVEPDGRPLIVTDGIQRLRYRLSLLDPVFVKRNAPYQINIDAGVTSYVFSRGHRLRLEVSSSNFPKFDRNLNSTQPVAGQRKITKARQTVFHDSRYPSAVVLPIIPGPEGRQNSKLFSRAQQKSLQR
jgi:putative CocE/NonD family hydrolase